MLVVKSAVQNFANRRAGLLRALLFLYGALNAVLYVALLPLWEGFDEPFHYGYVEELSRRHRLPRLGDTVLPDDVCKSLAIAPVSHVVKHNLAFAPTFDEYFHLAPAQRTAARSALRQLLPNGQAGNCGLNYEAQQAPLAYLVLASIDRLMDQSSLIRRALTLRLVCGLFASLASIALLFQLARRLRLEDRSANAVVFIALSSQMFYATTCHVANDWLAVPIMIWFFERLLAVPDRPTGPRLALLAASLAGGLLTKSYFLAMLPVATALILAALGRRRISCRGAALFFAILLIAAGPWCLRNWRLYGHLAGLQETARGMDWAAFLGSVKHLPWLRSLQALAFASIWTGNNSDLSFSRSTIACFLLGLVALGASCVLSLRGRRLPARERFALAACGLYLIALMYSTALTFWSTGGAAVRTASWYTQPIIPVLLAILFSGPPRVRILRNAAACWLVVLSAYIISVTYWAKLIPLYSGYPEGRSVLSELISWYANNLPGALDSLSATALGGNGQLVIGLACATTAVSVVIASALCGEWLFNDRRTMPGASAQPGSGSLR
jgi:hypothetical protein